MWSRGRLDITIRDFVAAFACACSPGNRQRTMDRLNRFSEVGTAIPCLSVRSAFDTLLSVLNYSPADEILFSAISVPAMQQIAEEHGLVAVRLDVQSDVVFPSVSECRARITKRTRAIVLAPLFGAQVDLAPFRTIADEFDLILVEDAAQAFDGVYRGSPAAHVSLFSFGPIKRATALGGAIAVFHSPELACCFRDAQSSLPVQPVLNFIRRSAKLLMLHLLSGRIAYAILFRLTACFGRNPDTIVANSVKGFPATQLMQQIRQQPCTPLLRLLNRRVRTADLHRYAGHAERFDTAIRNMLPNGVVAYGSNHPNHRFWLCPVLLDEPEEVAVRLRAHGFDATSTHRLAVIPDSETESSTKQAFERVLFLPCYPEISNSTLHKMMVTFSSIISDLKKDSVNPSETGSTPAQRKSAPSQ